MTQPTIDPAQLIGHTFTPITYTYTERDAMLYALSVGAPTDPLGADELAFVYEIGGLKVLPTYPVIFASGMITTVLSGELPGLRFDPFMLLHGEQITRLHGPLPASATVEVTPRGAAAYDKGKATLLLIDAPCTIDRREVAFNQYAFFIRGLGGWGGDRGPASKPIAPPERAPDAVQTEVTSKSAALLYRLNGDRNALHADPAVAQMAGFERPILHGLATFGYAGRAVLRHFCGNDPARFRGIRARFAQPVFPGETLTTEMWQTDAGVIFQTKAAERDVVVLANALVEVA